MVDPKILALRKATTRRVLKSKKFYHELRRKWYLFWLNWFFRYRKMSWMTADAAISAIFYNATADGGLI